MNRREVNAPRVLSTRPAPGTAPEPRRIALDTFEQRVDSASYFAISQNSRAAQRIELTVRVLASTSGLAALPSRL